MRVIGIVGYKDSGKTSLIEEIIKNSNKKFGVIKHVHEEIDIKDKDSYRFKEAGAKIVALTSDKEEVIFENPKGLEEILSYFYMKELDFVLIEGFKKELNKLNIPKIVLLRDREEGELIDDYTALVIENNYNIDEVLKVIEEKAIIPTMNLNCKHCGYNCKGFVKALIKGEAKWDDCVLAKGRVKLVVDDKIIPLSPFVDDIVGNTIIAMIKTLKGVKDPKKINISINVKG
ncbi:molybdopterin-guanine dinucleotide biosynthesis protein B [Methanocaldococcus infernus]|uniref:Molybdopterin-guanine dinucleotide biosynthesis protein B n=1 Tax=Methanocaldococcus infernus (strain DSM 11812 / JCM 15783 / ME) TaxID=573063 RepID=D5VS84_METIM|nr:molybdopterin-guanine dinucleotide biosynthesis protein B [Methanocaldococcus infernus]ADG13437.1 molybdopterin-guanine dinucleotide biosynthesis protein B [Methanocaldococcus infernus ME]